MDYDDSVDTHNKSGRSIGLPPIENNNESYTEPLHEDFSAPTCLRSVDVFGFFGLMRNVCGVSFPKF
jgi:hypothetical protein